MRFKIEIVVDEENGETTTEELFTLEKSYDGDGLVGLSLSESKRLLKKLQQVIVLHQTSQYTASHRCWGLKPNSTKSHSKPFS
jgi:adenosylmethionine-8-amino-7-oxononanoate aminotransferase